MEKDKENTELAEQYKIAQEKAIKEQAEAKVAKEALAKEQAEAEEAANAAKEMGFAFHQAAHMKKKKAEAQKKIETEIALQNAIKEQKKKDAEALNKSLGLTRLLATPISVFAQLATEQLNDVREAHSALVTKELSEQAEAKNTISNVELANDREVYRYSTLLSQYTKEVKQFDMDKMTAKHDEELSDKRYKEHAAEKATKRANNAYDRMHSQQMDNNNKRIMIERMEKKIQDNEAKHAQAMKKAEFDGRAKKADALKKKHEEEHKIEVESKRLQAAKSHLNIEMAGHNKTLKTLEQSLQEDKKSLQRAHQRKEETERKYLDMKEEQARRARREIQTQKEIRNLKADVDAIKLRNDKEKILSPSTSHKGEKPITSGSAGAIL